MRRRKGVGQCLLLQNEYDGQRSVRNPWSWLKGDGERTPFDSLAVEVGRVGRLGG